MGNAYRIFAASRRANKAQEDVSRMQMILNSALLLLERKNEELSFYQLERTRIVSGSDIYSDPVIQGLSLDVINENIEKKRMEIIHTMGVIRIIRRHYDSAVSV